LEILQKYDCSASFFIIGKKTENNEDIVRDMFAAGHSIGNHSYEHSNLFPLLSGKKITEDIAKTSDILQGITGTKVKYFRPPFGVTNPRIYRGLRGSDLKVIGWSVRSFDTKNEEAGTVVKRITRRLKGGDIILLHDTSDHILDILEKFMQEIEKSDLRPVALDTLFED
jgi:peptidoglycan/xylan/chitin deacetylase (PgdA/CDA1 family)